MESFRVDRAFARRGCGQARAGPSSRAVRLLSEHRVKIDRAKDDLSQVPALDTMNRALLSVHTPSCIALYGAWGSGKTALLHSAYEEWKTAGRAAVWFDPWEHEGRGDVITPLLHQLTKVAAKDPDRADKAKAMAAAILKTLLSFGFRLGMTAMTGGLLGADVAKFSGLSREKVTDHLFFDEWVAYQDEVEELKERFAKLVDPVQRWTRRAIAGPSVCMARSPFLATFPADSYGRAPWTSA